jgi:serpin B
MRPLLASALALVLIGCPGGWGTSWTPPAAPPDDVKAVVTGTNQFAIDLYHVAAATPGDVFLSPPSIAAAFGMTLAGAQGATQDELAKALRLTLPPERTPAALGSLLSVGPELAVANRLWGEQGETFLAPFLATTGSAYGAELMGVDFKQDPAGARGTINDWVEERTRGQIPELLRAGDVDAFTRLVITNAVHFEARWEEEFDADLTQDATFTLASGEEVKAPFMSRKLTTRGYQGPDFALVELPYKGGRYAMVVVVPTAHDGLPALEKALTAEALKGWLDGATQGQIAVCLPRFQLEASLDLVPVMQTLGVKDLFDPTRADLSGMTGDTAPALFVGSARHTARVKVHEEGTEAAAATVVSVHATSAAVPMVLANRPFLFLIHDRQSGLVWFVGRETDPRS